MNIRQAVQRAHEHNNDDQITVDEFEDLSTSIEESLSDNEHPNTPEDWRALRQAHFVNDTARDTFFTNLRTRLNTVFTQRINTSLRDATDGTLNSILENIRDGRGMLNTSEQVCAEHRSLTNTESALDVARGLGCAAEAILGWNPNSQLCQTYTNTCVRYETVLHPTPLGSAVTSLFPENWGVDVHEEGVHILFPGQLGNEADLQSIHINFSGIREPANREYSRRWEIRTAREQQQTLAEHQNQLRPYNSFAAFGIYAGLGNVVEAGFNLRLSTPFSPRPYNFHQLGYDPQNRFNMRHGAIVNAGYRFPLASSLREHLFSTGAAYTLSMLWTSYTNRHDVAVTEVMFAAGANVWTNFGNTTYIEPFIEASPRVSPLLSMTLHFGVPINISTGETIFYVAMRINLDPIRTHHRQQ